MRLLLKTALLISLATLAMPGWAMCISGDCENGYGVWVWSDGESYEGDSVDGAPHGKGVYRWANGASYKGNFVRGEKPGNGVQKYARGTW